MTCLDRFSLKNKIVYVLGGSGTIGEKICLSLAELDATILNIDISNNNKFKKNKNIKFSFFDLRNLVKSKNFLTNQISKYGVPEIFINCSYPISKDWAKSTFSKTNLKSIQQNINLHLNSYIWFAIQIAEEMKTNKVKGSIIQFGSTYGSLGQDLTIYEGTDMKENSIYSAIKGGIINHSKQMASFYGKYQIRVNTISPGGVQGKIAGKHRLQSKKFIKNYSKKTPLKRMAKPSDIVPAVIFLASEASSYITGTNLIVDGGWSII